MKSVRLLLALTVLLSLLAISCSETSSPGGNGASDLPKLRFSIQADHHHLDPQRMSWLHDVRIAECLYEPLLRIKLPDLTLEPGAAASYDVSDDQLTYTFHLRPEARWSNGDSLLASDFVYAWQRVLMPDLAADYTQLFFGIRGAPEFFAFRRDQLARYVRDKVNSPAAVQQLLAEARAWFEQNVGIKATDERTLVVELSRPVPYFLELVAFATFVPNHQASMQHHQVLSEATGMLSIESDYFNSPDKLVTNGPYRLSQRRFKRDLTLLPNSHYWNHAATANGGIVELINENVQGAILQYTQGEVDLIPDVPTATSFAADLVAQNRPDVHLTPAAGTYFYNFNCRPLRPDGSPNPLADARVRRALSMGIDRATIVGKVTRLPQPEARTFVPPGSLPNYDPPIEAGATYNPADARTLLAEAGYPGGKGLTGLSILYNTGHGHENIAQVIKRQWETDLGVSVALEGVESSVFGERLKTQNFQIARASWFGDYRDPTTFLDKFITGNGNNDADWSNPEYDQLMQRASNELNPTARMALLREAEALMLTQQPIAPIYQYVKLQMYDADKVHNLHPNAWDFRRMERVRITR